MSDTSPSLSTTSSARASPINRRPITDFPEIRLDGNPPLDIDSVAALLFLADGRYLLQLRDNKPGLALRNHWVLFGGAIEVGETSGAALRREIREELRYDIREYRWYYEAVFVLPRRERRIVRRVVYTVPILAGEFEKMVLHEGAEMRLFTVAEMLALPRVSPWDLAAVLMHVREARLFAL